MSNIIRNINALVSVKSVKPEEEIIISDLGRPKRINIKDFTSSVGTVIAAERVVDIVDTDGAKRINLQLPTDCLIHEVYIKSAKQNSTGVGVFVEGVGVTTGNSVTIAVPKYGTTKVKHFPDGGNVTASVTNVVESTLTVTIFYSKYIHI